MLKVTRRDTVPPGGWRYFQGETKTWIKAASFEELKREVVKHRNANHLPVGGSIDEEIEEQVCKSIDPGHCEHATKPGLFGAARKTFGQIMQGTTTLIEHFILGGRTVPDDEANRRGGICAACFFNVDPEGCKPCHSQDLKDLVNRIVANRKVANDVYLKSCQVCGCALQAKTRIPLDVLQNHISDEQNEQFPPWCWVKR